MTWLMVIILGLVQGVAEFLPISSSGHLSLLQHFFGLEQVDDLFNILLHFATLVAVAAVYWRDVKEMIVEFFRGLADLFSKHGSREIAPPPARRLVLLVVLGTLPLLAALPLDDKLEQLGEHPAFVACALILTGFILFLSDRLGRGRKTERSARVTDALLVGLAQACATIPGLSRSGCTISAGMTLGFDRKFAVRYSFLLSLPAVLGATLLKVVKAIGSESVDLALLPKYLVGMAVAGVVGYFSIQLVKLLADRKKFGKFAYYCWIAGFAALLALLVFR